MIVYHEASPDVLDSILTHGLKRTSRGGKGSELSIIRTDQLLDAVIPERLRRHDVSRDNNIYGLLTVGHNLIDITDGSLVPLNHRIRTHNHPLLQMDVSPERCYISDLDLYDSVKSAISEGKPSPICNEVASLYWSSLIRLDTYEQGRISRPEVMITYDLPPQSITVVS